MRIVIMLLFSLYTTTAFPIDVYVSTSHYSQIFHKDYGLTTIDFGMEGCKKALCIEGSISSPIGEQDYKYEAPLGHIQIKYKLWEKR